MNRLHLGFVPAIFAIVLSSGVAHSHLRSPHYAFGSQNSLTAYLLLALLHGLTAHAAGLPDEVGEMQPALAASVLSSALATAGWLTLQAFFPGLLPRWVIFTSAVAVAAFTFLLGASFVLSSRRSERKDRVFSLLTAYDTLILENDCEATFPAPERSFTLVDSLEVDLTPLGPRSKEVIEARIADADPAVLVLSTSTAERDDIYAIAAGLHRHGMQVQTLSDFYSEHFGKLPVSDLGRMALLFDIRDRRNPAYKHTKHLLDLVGALAAGVVCAAATPFVLVGNRIANRGPLLYRQPRIGRDGKLFTLYKFRTMRADSVDPAGAWTAPNDPRITPFGRILRRTHVDELPQFLNIFRGELSLVGPRPEQPHYVRELTDKEPAFALRQLVTPGLTGWAQVKFRYAATEAAALEKLQFDLYYLANQSLALDLRILSRTIRSVLRHRGT